MTLLGRALILISMIAAFSGCGSSGSSATTASGRAIIGDPDATQAQGEALSAVNILRRDAGVPALAMSAALNGSATLHAGYLTIRASGLTHYESIDGSGGGAADSGNPFYRGVTIPERIRASNEGADIYAPAYIYYEDIASIGGVASIPFLWNTVYHRLPLMRHESNLFGFGDQDHARAARPQAGVGTGNGFATADLAGDLNTPVTVTLSVWPNNCQDDVPRAFSSNSERPDPVSSANAGQSPHTPDIDQVGPPIHMICPTFANWSSIAARVRKVGTSVDLPLIVLAGFAKLDPSNPSTTPFPAVAIGATACDRALEVGEIFIMTRGPLAADTKYEVRITATTQTPGETFAVGTSSPWTFTTE
jgi:hypothetical protein